MCRYTLQRRYNIAAAIQFASWIELQSGDVALSTVAVARATNPRRESLWHGQKMFKIPQPGSSNVRHLHVIGVPILQTSSGILPSRMCSSPPRRNGHILTNGVNSNTET
jgi:hypothetical protein